MSRQNSVAAARSSEYVTWLSRIDDDTREKIGEILLAVDVSSPLGVAELAKRMIVECVKGNIAPAIADSVVKWAELMLSAITIDKVKNNPNTNVVVAFHQEVSSVIHTINEAQANAQDLSKPAQLHDDNILDSHKLSVLDKSKVVNE